VSTDQVLSTEFEKLKKDLIEAHDRKGMRASGKWANSLEVITGTDTVKLIGEEYSQQLESGRAPGRYPPIVAIKQWILDKGIFNQVLQNIKLSSLAFLIAKKIAEEGWKRQGKGGVELISEIVTEERIQLIIDEVGNVKILEITTEITDLIENLR